LILGLYEPSQGRVLLDDRLLSGGEWRSWREQVGVVTQDDQLFSGSIAENICFFDQQADFSRIREAALAAAIDADIMAMPQQYAMLVGDMGAALSAGQRQRVLLARALYRRPRILILDEGTANLDLANELSIGEVIRNLDITRVVVAHRPALIDIADRTVNVSRGMLAAGGDDEAGIAGS
jgi:ATP-binding cassette subfamily B protein RaxB